MNLDINFQKLCLLFLRCMSFNRKKTKLGPYDLNIDIFILCCCFTVSYVKCDKCINFCYGEKKLNIKKKSFTHHLRFRK